MSKLKSLYDISWQVTEEEYRKDHALSYSTLARYEREGFNNLSKLFDKLDTPSLVFGSAVDSIITGGMEEFDSRFLVAEFPSTSDNIVIIVKDLFREFSITHSDLKKIPDVEVIRVAASYNYSPHWKAETRAKNIKEKGAEYYNLMYVAGDKTIISTALWNEILATVNSLKESPATSNYFAKDNPFEPDIERLYQLKFKGSFEDINYRCMADLILINHKEKIIIPVDLKTSSKTEWDFPKSFVDWLYILQARLYWNIIRQNLDKDEYFKDFTLLDYRFIVVNKRTLTPLLWCCKSTQKEGTLILGKQGQYVFRSPFEIGRELSYYLRNKPRVPMGIHINKLNDIEMWLNNG